MASKLIIKNFKVRNPLMSGSADSSKLESDLDLPSDVTINKKLEFNKDFKSGLDENKSKPK
jgi:hypothetical protein